MDGMLLTYAAAAGMTVIGFLLWEPYTARIRAGRNVKIADSIRFVDPGACFLFVNWSEAGDRTLGPCYIERIARGWITLRSFEDGHRLVLTGDQMQKCLRHTFPHPDDINETLYFVDSQEAERLGVLPWPGTEKVIESLRGYGATNIIDLDILPYPRPEKSQGVFARFVETLKMIFSRCEG